MRLSPTSGSKLWVDIYRSTTLVLEDNLPGQSLRVEINVQYSLDNLSIIYRHILHTFNSKVFTWLVKLVNSSLFIEKERNSLGCIQLYFQSQRILCLYMLMMISCVTPCLSPDAQAFPPRRDLAAFPSASFLPHSHRFTWGEFITAVAASLWGYSKRDDERMATNDIAALEKGVASTFRMRSCPSIANMSMKFISL